MYEYDEQYYPEPSPFDQEVDVLVQAVKAAVKQDIQTEMERLRKENSDLQEVKAMWDSMQREHKAKLREMEEVKRNAVQEARRARFTELFSGRDLIMYKASYDLKRGPKCDKCDDSRRIAYTTPLGREAYEDCECAERFYVYHVAEYETVEFHLYQGENHLTMFFKPYDRDGYVMSDTVKPDNVYYGEAFEEEKTWYFRDREDCQRYVDYLNAKEKRTNIHGNVPRPKGEK